MTLLIYHGFGLPDSKIARRLFQRFTDQNKKYLLIQFKYEILEFQVQCSHVEYSLHFQRYYLFYNVPNGVGDKWQRNLFLSIINFEPIGQIEWVQTVISEGESKGKVLNLIESLDGQQRTRTWQAIWEGDVKLPTNTIISYKGTNLDMSNKNIKEIKRDFPEYFNNWVSTYSFIVLESKLERTPKHKRFQKVNDHNTLSAQDVRSTMDNVFAKYLNEMILSSKPQYSFMELNTQSLDFKHLGCSAKGKLLQEIIAKFAIYVHKDKIVNFGKTNIDKLYNDYDKGVLNDKTLIPLKRKIEKVLKTANYIITHSNSKKFWKKRDILFLLVILYRMDI